MTNTQHATSGPSDVPSVPEPPFAERTRTLLHVARLGTLSTQLHKTPGFPFGSVMPFGVDGAGRPTFLISSMAVHTQNLLADPRASLLVMQPDWPEDPLAGSRATLVGPATVVPADDLPAVREEYLGRHANARYWVDFTDFAFYRMEIAALYYVAGFGAMGWVEAADYAAAVPDPLADHAAGIITHMNADHADALRLYCQAFAGLAVDSATLTAVDRMGMRIRAQVGDRLRGLRINFSREVHTPTDARKVLVAMVQEARAKLS